MELATSTDIGRKNTIRNRFSNWKADFTDEVFAELVNGIVRSPGMQESLARMYALPYPGTPESLRQLVEKDTARWGTLIKAAGIEPM